MGAFTHLLLAENAAEELQLSHLEQFPSVWRYFHTCGSAPALLRPHLVCAQQTPANTHQALQLHHDTNQGNIYWETSSAVTIREILN